MFHASAVCFSRVPFIMGVVSVSCEWVSCEW